MYPLRPVSYHPERSRSSAGQMDRCSFLYGRIPETAVFTGVHRNGFILFIVILFRLRPYCFLISSPYMKLLEFSYGFLRSCSNATIITRNIIGFSADKINLFHVFSFIQVRHAGLAQLYNSRYNDNTRAKSLNPRQASLPMGERIISPPHMEHEVEICLHESAECGRSVEARSAKRSGYHDFTTIS